MERAGLCGACGALRKLSKKSAGGPGRTLTACNGQIVGADACTTARGKRQFQDEVELANVANLILKEHQVEDFLAYTFERQEKRQSKYIGRGRGTPDRPTQVIITVRYQITTIIRQEEALAAYQKTQ